MPLIHTADRATEALGRPSRWPLSHLIHSGSHFLRGIGGMQREAGPSPGLLSVVGAQKCDCCYGSLGVWTSLCYPSGLGLTVARCRGYCEKSSSQLTEVLKCPHVIRTRDRHGHALVFWSGAARPGYGWPPFAPHLWFMELTCPATSPGEVSPVSSSS
jgi:hypothetical protein